MSGRLRPLPFRKVDKGLRKIGFAPVRSAGSHVRYEHPDGRKLTVPNHPGRDIARGTLRAILRYLEMTPEEFERLL